MFSLGDGRTKYSMEQKIKVIKLYREGVGLRTIERAEGISTPLLIYWIRTLGRMLKQHLVNTAIPEHAKDIAILKINELFTFYKKIPKSICLACCGPDRNRNEIIDIVVSKSRDKMFYVRMAQRLKRKGYKVAILCTD